MKGPRGESFSNRANTGKLFLKGGRVMPRRIKTDKEIWQGKVIKEMKNLNVYKKEYNRLIEIYVDLNMQYDMAMGEFMRSGYQYETETAAGGTKKSAIVATLESLRKDIVTYSDRLCLNPKAVDSVKIDIPKKSVLAETLRNL
jgi:phage terminase small subunit